jgi:2-oxoglutarate ferredoxin oxidoreductase subunit alpha
MQLAGTQMTNTSAIFGNDVSTLPDFPAEIRAPAGTPAGVSGYQLAFGSHKLRTPGDRVNALIAMNPAALKVHLRDLREGGLLIVNSATFEKKNLDRAGYPSNPLDDPALESRYRLHKIDITRLTMDALEGLPLNVKEKERCKNFFALGLVSWIYDRPIAPTVKWIEKRFAKHAAILEANTRALKAGYHFGETAEIFTECYGVEPAEMAPGLYRSMTGNRALAWGILAAAERTKLPVVYGAYPITPASDILHEMSQHKRFRVRTMQAEDEMAAVGAVIGAAFGGAIGVTASTSTSGSIIVRFDTCGMFASASSSKKSVRTIAGQTVSTWTPSPSSSIESDSPSPTSANLEAT